MNDYVVHMYTEKKKKEDDNRRQEEAVLLRGRIERIRPGIVVDSVQTKRIFFPWSKLSGGEGKKKESVRGERSRKDGRNDGHCTRRQAYFTAATAVGEKP